VTSKPKMQQAWPRNAEKRRVNAIDGATDARELGDTARKHGDALRVTLEKAVTALNQRNLTYVELLLAKATSQVADMQTAIADMQATLSDVTRELEVARIGIVPQEDA